MHRHADTPEGPPRLTVIVPTYNRRDRVRACVEGLCAQTAPPTAFEVIVVVDGSTDGTEEALRELDPPFALTVITQENRGWSAALNRGTQAAAGAVCLFLDDDILPSTALVAAHLRAHEDRPGIVGIGQMTLRIPADADWFLRAYQRSWTGHYRALNDASRAVSWTDCFGGNVSAPRRAILDVGGLPTDLRRGRDIEFGYRLQQAGLPFVYLADALGHQDERKRFGELAVDFERAGQSWVEIYRRHPPVLPELLGSYHHTRPLSKTLQFLGLALSVRPTALRWAVAAAGKRDDRAFHFLRNYCYWRGIRVAADRDLWRRLTSTTRILMYHAFAGPGESAGPYVLPIRRFTRHLRWLARLGFRFLSLEEYVTLRRSYRLPPARSVVVTIDDGYRDALTRAAPVLTRLNVPATVFVVTGRVSRTNDWSRDPRLAGRPLLSWEEIRALASAGVAVGAHTRTHPDLTRLLDAEALDEMEGSRRDLEEEVGAAARTFSYPFGACDDRVRQLAMRSGFLGCVGIEPGLNTVRTPVHDLARIEVFGTDSVARLAAKVLLGAAHAPRLRPRLRFRRRSDPDADAAAVQYPGQPDP